MLNSKDIWSLDPLVVVRTINAGVHIGELIKVENQTVQLANARRLFSWSGANTLNEVSQHGVNFDSDTKISEPVPIIMLMGVIELIPVSDQARKNLTTSRWPK